jgi:hypothetical protein
MYTQVDCPCCNSQPVQISAQLSQFVIWRITGNNPGSDTDTVLCHCEQCDFYFSLQRFEDNEMHRLYQGYRNEMYNQMRKQCEPAYKEQLYSLDYINSRKEFINLLIYKHVSNLQSILDYGGDDGAYIPDVPVKFVYDVSGVEPVPGVNKYLLDNHDCFDLVMNCQVLEHVSDVNKLIIDLKARTKEYLYIEVPAYRDPPAVNMVIGEHINFFREQSLHALLNKHNINIVDTAVDYDLKVLAVLGKI